MLRVLMLVVGLALAAWFLYRVVAELDRAVRKRVLTWLAVLVVLGLGVLALRFGAHWLPLVAAGALGLARRLLPLLLRFLPVAWGRWARRERAHTGSRSHDQANRARRRANMTRAEALEILGLSEGASASEITAAYKRLIRHAHPDKPGGSEYFASKLNQAKSVLLP